MTAIFQFLGTGASTGIPVIGCSCAVCKSPILNNQRLRPSGWIRLLNRSLLVDVGPDFRQQALKYKIQHLDGLLLTHTHFDHLAGIDELRIFYLNQKKSFPCLLSQDSCKKLAKRYDYLFQPIGHAPNLHLQLDLHVLPEEMGQIEFLDLPIDYFHYFQGTMKVTGYRLGEFAYVSDIQRYGEEIFHALKGVRQLVLGALQRESSRSHFSLDQAVAFARKVGAKMTYITHIGHLLDHDATNQTLPSDIQLASDGLEIEFEV